MKNKALIWIIVAVVVIIAIVATVNNNQSDIGDTGGTGTESGTGGQETYTDFDAGGDESVFGEIDDNIGALG